MLWKVETAKHQLRANQITFTNLFSVLLLLFNEGDFLINLPWIWQEIVRMIMIIAQRMMIIMNHSGFDGSAAARAAN